jgi:anti-sigma factor RsiW
MKTFEDQAHSVESAAIDRLVDGELSEVERRELLLRLENDPEGWRRCALAFLEDQAWRSALVGFSSTASRPGPLAGSTTRPARRRHWLGRASIAATLLASTFAAGFAAGGIARALPGAGVASSELPGPVESTGAATVAQAAGQIQEVGKIDVVDGSNGESQVQTVPIFSGPGLDDRWLRSQPSTVPDYLRARWERQGYQVEERRQLVSVTLEDGRRVSIPLDEVELAYVGQNPL